MRGISYNFLRGEGSWPYIMKEENFQGGLRRQKGKIGGIRGTKQVFTLDDQKSFQDHQGPSIAKERVLCFKGRKNTWLRTLKKNYVVKGKGKGFEEGNNLKWFRVPQGART